MRTAPQQTPHDALDALLRASRPAPVPPADFSAAVWRRIAERDAVGAAAWSWIDRLAEVLIRPRVALAGLAALLVLGAGAGVRSGVAAARADAMQRYLAAVAPGLEH